jgi:3-dehydroquinate synthase
MNKIPNPHKVAVSLADRSYEISIGAGLFDEAYDFLASRYSNKSIFVITDQAIISLFAQNFIDGLSNKGPDALVYSVPSGEGSKSIKQYWDLLEWLARSGAKRDSLIIALGGGVIGDLAGFVAASYMRGIAFIQIPTTLLAQVDSSVGGKTAVNIPAGKNLVGAFYQPQQVFCDSALLKTLPEREMRAGYAEIYKYGLLWDADFMHWLHENGAQLLKHDEAALHYAVKRCCEIKAEIVSKDEKESNIRALLNLGHTFAHALEALCLYDDRLRHGEAVSIGMCMAADLSYTLGHLSQGDVQDVVAHLKSVGLPTGYSDIKNKPEISTEAMLTLMLRDKKANAEGITFIAMERLGKAVVDTQVPEAKLREVLDRFISAA